MPTLHVLYTGGTIGSAGQPLQPMAGEDFSRLLDGVPGFAGGRLDGGELTWTLSCLEPPLDSADMAPPDWLRIARATLERSAGCDGVVVLHGTDTLAWTAAALSFLLAGIPTPVVLTGSQRPLAAPGTDAIDNLRLALRDAASGLPGVRVAFGGRVLPAVGVLKIDAAADVAFDAPQGTLSSVGDWADSNPAERLARIDPSVRVACLHLYPGIEPATLDAVLAQPVAGLVLAAYGAGNAPSAPAFLASLRKAHARGVTIVVVTQALRGVVRLGEYQTGAGLEAAGAVSGGGMSPVAACAKLWVLRAQGYSQADTAALMQRSLVGE